MAYALLEPIRMSSLRMSSRRGLRSFVMLALSLAYPACDDVPSDGIAGRSNVGVPPANGTADAGTDAPGKPNEEPEARTLNALEVFEDGAAPKKTISIVSPGMYRAVVHQATGGGLSELYDLASDPDAKRNVAWRSRGLFEVGWHGQCPDDAACGTTRDWPSNDEWRAQLGVVADTRIIERSAVRVRIQVDTVLTWWQKLADPAMPITVVYTFYPAGQVYAQVRIRRLTGAFKWSQEYGPHIAVSASRTDPLLNAKFTFDTPTTKDIADTGHVPSSALVLAKSELVPTTVMLTIPPAKQQLFTSNFRHDGRTVDWDRAGYGSGSVSMAAGYDDTWSCLLQLGTDKSAGLPTMRTAAAALPYADQYRTPPKITGATLVTNDAGDFDHDGFNESDGSIVLEAGTPLSFSYDCGESACFAPVFKVLGWKGAAPTTVAIAGKKVPVVAAVTESNLSMQVQGHLTDRRGDVVVSP